MRHLFKQKIYFLFPHILFLLAGGILLAVRSKSQIHLFLNQFHHPVADVIFKNLTYLGEGYIAIFFFIVLMCMRYRYALIYAVSVISASLLTQALKYTFDQDRPLRFFEATKTKLYLVSGVDMNIYYSFPSGHTTAAFAVYFSLAIFADNKYLKMFLFILALLIGYSRVYLSQHFFQDIYVGSIIGTLVSFLLFHIINNSNWLNNKTWADKHLLHTVKKK